LSGRLRKDFRLAWFVAVDSVHLDKVSTQADAAIKSIREQQAALRV
jgi:hypothetical protein